MKKILLCLVFIPVNLLALDWQEFQDQLEQVSENSLVTSKDLEKDLDHFWYTSFPGIMTPNEYYNLSQGYYFLGQKDKARAVVYRGRKIYPFYPPLGEVQHLFSPLSLPLSFLGEVGEYRETILFFLGLGGVALLVYGLLRAWPLRRTLLYTGAFLILTLTIALVPGSTGGIALSPIEVYWGDSHLFDKASPLSQGEVFRILRNKEGWTQILTEDAQKIWIPPETRYFSF